MPPPGLTLAPREGTTSTPICVCGPDRLWTTSTNGPARATVWRWAYRDYSSYDHVHVITVLERRLDRDNLCDLREHANEARQRECERCRDPLAAEFGRERNHDLEREYWP